MPTQDASTPTDCTFDQAKNTLCWCHRKQLQREPTVALVTC